MMAKVINRLFLGLLISIFLLNALLAFDYIFKWEDEKLIFGDEKKSKNIDTDFYSKNEDALPDIHSESTKRYHNDSFLAFRILI